VYLDSRPARGALVCCLTAIALFVPVKPAPATFPGANGKLAFDACGPQDCGIWVMNADGSDPTQLTHNPYRFRDFFLTDEDASWSADGTKIAFTRHTNGFQEVWVMDADGGNAHKVTDGLEPAWSPDGTRFALFGGWIASADGSASGPVIDGLRVRAPDWSPDGLKIAYDDYRQVGFQDTEIFIANADGTNRTSLTPPDFGGPRWENISPSWSPDGTRIAFSAGSPEPRAEKNIYVMQADGTDKVPITTNPAEGRGFAEGPVWSPDGTRIAYYRYGFLGNELVVMNADGTSPVALGFGARPAWQPITNRPPDCTNVTSTPGTLWPPNRKLVPVVLSGATDPDGDQVTLTVTGVTQDERTRPRPDAEPGPASDQVRLRAERTAHGDGRVYRITFTVADGLGGDCSNTATVAVPRRPNRPAVDSAPPSYDSL
jgi:hypothetical protein